MAIMFDTKEGSTDIIKSRCFVQPKTELIKERIAGAAAIEIECPEIPECKEKVCAQPFDVEAELVYEPFKYEREVPKAKREVRRMKRKRTR